MLISCLQKLRVKKMKTPMPMVRVLFDLILCRCLFCADAFLPMYTTDADLPSVQLVNKWEGPQTYMEDFYAGGDFPPDVASLRTPSHLTPGGTPGAVADEGGDFLTPEFLSPASPSAAAETEATGLLGGEREDARAEDVPIFSMPAEADNIEEIGLKMTNEPDTDISVLEDLYTGLQDDPLPEAASLIPLTPLAPVTDPTATVLDLHIRDSEPTQISAQGHLDWNDPPAFPAGRIASKPGHLTPVHAATKDSIELSPEVAASDVSDEEDEPESIGPIPLGTSDLDIPVDAPYDEDSVEDIGDQTIQGLPGELSADIVDILRDDALIGEGKSGHKTY
jgi:hypothetical protein